MSEYERLTTDYIIISETGAEIPQPDLAAKRWSIERSNLLNIAKICIKSLIDNSLTAGTGRILTEEFTLLEQFFTILEHIVQHGLKVKRLLLGPKKEFMAVLDALESKVGVYHSFRKCAPGSFDFTSIAEHRIISIYGHTRVL